jgi:Protein of unknown function (DUF2795)
MTDDTRRTRLEEGLEEVETRMGQPSPLAQSLQQALLGAVFPLSLEQLLLLARENEAPPAVLSLLSSLPQRRFESLDAVEQGLEPQVGESKQAIEAPQAPLYSR